MAPMLRFANPEFLWLMPFVGVLGWWQLRRRRPALRFADTRLFDGLTTGRPRRAKWGGAVLRCLAAISLILACAGPRRPDLQTRLPTEGIAIVLALDVSGSMATKDAEWERAQPPVTRLEAARRAFSLFVDGGDAPDGTHFEPRASDRIGLVTFAALPETACPLTLNHTVLLNIANSQEPKFGLDAGTNIGDALAESLIRLEAAGDRRKVLILLSDGEHNVSEPETLRPRQSAQLAANLGVKVYTIDAGGNLPADATQEAIQQRLAGKTTLEAVATITGGRSFTASDGSELLAAYHEIDELEKSPTVSFVYRRYHEYYPCCAAATFLLLVLTHLLERTRWRVLP